MINGISSPLGARRKWNLKKKANNIQRLSFIKEGLLTVEEWQHLEVRNEPKEAVRTESTVTA
jgi:hypothetical protein